MKKFWIFILSTILLAFVFAFLWKFYPKNIGLFPGFVILFVLDLYLFWVYNSNIWRKSKLRGIVLSFVFWLPMLMLMSMAIISLVYPYEYWEKSFKTYYAGIILAGFTAKLVPVVLILISDSIKLIRKLTGLSAKKKEQFSFNESRSKFIKQLGLISGGILFGTLNLGMFKWIYDFKVRKKIVSLPNLPASFEGFRIVQISDIHLGSWLSKNELKEAVNIINDLNADVVFFTGDLVNYATDEAFLFEGVLKNIQGKYGVYSTLGNHDYGDYKRWESAEAKETNLKEMYALHKRMGWKLLRNENDILNRNGDQLAIIGVENWGSMKRFQKFGDLDTAIQGAEGVPVKLLLSHDPSHWQLKVLRHKIPVDITFAGHTHGAQFGIEIPGIRWSPSQYIYKYWAGLYSEKNKQSGTLQHLYVNRGLGAIGYPGRVGILPEITLVELQS